MVNRLAKTGVFFVAIGGPLLYLGGFGYDAGYLSAFSLSADVIPRDTIYYWTSAFVAIMHWFEWVIAHSGMLVLFSAAVGAYLAISWSVGEVLSASRLFKRVESVFSQFANNERLMRFVIRPVLAGTVAVWAFWVIILLIGLLIVTTVLFYREGERQGVEIATDAVTCRNHRVSTNRVTCVEILLQSREVIRGIVVIHRSDLLAIFDGGETKVFQNGSWTQVRILPKQVLGK